MSLPNCWQSTNSGGSNSAASGRQGLGGAYRVVKQAYNKYEKQGSHN